MPDPLRDIILDFREAVLPTGVPRRVDVTPVAGKATLCIGPRRAGKSTFLFQQVQEDPNGREVDFVVPMPDGARAPVQVCETLAEPRTRKREVTAPAQAMAAPGGRTGTVVTRDEEETIRVDGGSIEVVPAWRFLLDVG
ncbi:MAG: hypothetical protein OXH04_07845 [Acidobacteria bacterium]|nr:hypothetical protein [Acidobacteriota bacterium]